MKLFLHLHCPIVGEKMKNKYLARICKNGKNSMVCYKECYLFKSKNALERTIDISKMDLQIHVTKAMAR